MFFSLLITVMLPQAPADLQGEWHVFKMLTRETGEAWLTHTFSYPIGPSWRVRGGQVDVTYRECVVSQSLRTDTRALSWHPDFPAGGKTGVQFVDHDGFEYTGRYTLNKDGTVTLQLISPADVARDGKPTGMKSLILHLERPRPRVDPLRGK